MWGWGLQLDSVLTLSQPFTADSISIITIVIIIIIIYHDFLPQPRRSSHIKSDNTHNHRHTPLSHILDNCTWIFGNCALFTVYPNCIMYWHPTPLQVITTRAQEGGLKEHRAKQKNGRHSVTYVPGLSTLSDLSRIDVQPLRSFHSSVAQGHLHTIHPA